MKKVPIKYDRYEGSNIGPLNDLAFISSQKTNEIINNPINLPDDVFTDPRRRYQSGKI